MTTEWLIQTSVDISLLITLVLLSRKIVRKVLGGQVAYWLWSIPLVYLVFPDFTIGQGTVLEPIYSPIDRFSSTVLDAPEVSMISQWHWVSVTWLIGALVCLIIRAIAWIQFHRQIQEQAERISLSPNLSYRVSEKIGDKLTKIQFFTLSNTQSPFVTGLFRPKIYLPHDFEHRFSLEQQVWVLAHEIKHIHRKDLWVQSCAEILRAVFWFNPIVHWGVKAMRLDQEIACDHSVLKLCNTQERYHFGQALLIGMCGNELKISAEVPSLISQPRLDFFANTKERFVMLSKHKASIWQPVTGFSLCLVIATLSLVKAPSSFAQSKTISDEAISLEFKDIPLKQVINIIASFSSVKIVNESFVRDTLTVSIKQKNEPANKVMTLLLECGNYAIIDNENAIEIVRTASNDDVDSCVVTENGDVIQNRSSPSI